MTPSLHWLKPVALSLCLWAGPFPLACTVLAGEPPPDLGGCSELPIFEKYRAAGLVRRPQAEVVEVRLIADHHDGDDGCLSCYGTKIQLKLILESSGRECRLLEATAKTHEYNSCGGSWPDLELESRELTYRLGDEVIDLASSDLDELVLRSHEPSSALVLLGGNILYFEKVSDGGLLKRRLWTMDDPEDECCWGSTSYYLMRFSSLFPEEQRASAARAWDW